MEANEQSNASDDQGPTRCLDASLPTISESDLCHDQPHGEIAASREHQTKQRPNNSEGNNEIGAVQIDEQAPQLNRLFFLRRSLLERRRARREARRREANGETEEATQRQGATEASTEEHDAPSATVAHASQRGSNSGVLSSFITQRLSRISDLIEARLVEDEEGEVYEAEPVGFFEKKWKIFASAAGLILLALLAISISVFYASENDEEVELEIETSPPTLSPTFDARPTLEIVQERGYVSCGLKERSIDTREGLHIDLCRSVAAVVLGNPNSFVGVIVNPSSRWPLLLDRAVDMVAFGDTHTIEREIREPSTGSGFTFSTPYYYDGMIYAGNESFVCCAEEHKRYDECSPLQICAQRGSTHSAFLEEEFPSSYVTVTSSFQESTDALFNNTCNVIAGEKFFIRGFEQLDRAIRDGRYVLGSKYMTKEPLAIVTRNTDREFSDVVNWVIWALFSWEVEGTSKNLSLCQSYTGGTWPEVSKLRFANAVYCVGNYAEILDDNPKNRGMNSINNGTGMLYAIPFGNIDRDDIIAEEASAASVLTRIAKEGSLACGVIVPDNFEGSDVTGSGGLVGMSVDYCRTLSAAIFLGDPERVNFLVFRETGNSSVEALYNGTLDVLVGGRDQRKYDFRSSLSIGGLHFSTPYYYGNESAIDVDDVSFYSIATREQDVLFASFVNCVVLATIQAQENRAQKKDGSMPLAASFGRDLRWALRDAVAYSGSYDKIYAKNFGSNSIEETRGRNVLNNGGAQMLPFFHLHQKIVHWIED